jgi:hypothetical protein
VLNHFFRHRIKMTEVLVSGEESRWVVTNLSNYNFYGCIEIYYDNESGVRNSLGRCTDHSAKVNYLPAGESGNLSSILVPWGSHPATTFYAVALAYKELYDYKAVAATAFYNDNKGAVPPKSSASASSAPGTASCNSDVDYQGSNQTVTYRIPLGDKKGNVKVWYEMYQIADSIIIKNKNGAYLKQLYYQQGRASFDLPYDPVLFPGNFIDVVMIGNPSPQTRWTFNVNCPQ